MEIFSKYNRTLNSNYYAICDDLRLCSVEYSACVSGFWGLCLRPSPGLCPWNPLENLPPLLSPLANSWLRPWLILNKCKPEVYENKRAVTLLTISRTSAIFAILFDGKFFSSGTLQQTHNERL